MVNRLTSMFTMLMRKALVRVLYKWRLMELLIWSLLLARTLRTPWDMVVLLNLLSGNLVRYSRAMIRLIYVQRILRRKVMRSMLNRPPLWKSQVRMRASPPLALRNSILLKRARKMMDTGTLLGVKYHGGTKLNLKKYVEIQLENFAEKENGDFDVLEDGEIADLDEGASFSLEF
ncbi:hypothetical protein RHMOL_Rhmol10G0093200 [Rhododendron molle]|uniref:Uncharacterized protein n=1 Tax=Rhododendron molle TaxID=49168 RepID=A0ACC0M0P4_RHOML|nr:hypothetical protein RHMOL_Rhmol10G0093200 [Rhododendron molle]